VYRHIDFAASIAISLAACASTTRNSLLIQIPHAASTIRNVCFEFVLKAVLEAWAF
jgi:uncharacterized lipoprotein YmbA